MEQLDAALMDLPSERKARGAFFTPAEICRFVASWAIRSRTDSVLEPSCGDAAFLDAAGGRLREVGDSCTERHLFTFEQVQGIELHEGSARAAAAAVARAEIPATILVGDFFDVDPRPAYDVVIGNPPYIRYQEFSGEARAKAQRRALAQGVRLSGLASSWAAFTVHASQFLKPGGRLGLVLPAELLTVNYAAQVRSFLMDRFETIQLVVFEERVFPGVMEEVVLLLAEGVGPTDRFTLNQVRDIDELSRIDDVAASWRPLDTADKWVPALLPPSAIDAYSRLATKEFTTLSDWGSPYLGAVTGNNRYFALTAEQVDRLGLDLNDVARISPPGSRHLRGLTFTDRAWDEMRSEGSRVYLFYPKESRLSRSAAAYIAEGERMGVHRGYKCRVRKPWWRVPLVAQPHLILTYMNHDTPRLVRNGANVRHLNSVHGVRLRPDLREQGQGLLPVACLNSMTVLGAEMVGRSYGGGMLKLEPREAGRLPVPRPELLRTASDSLRAISPQLGRALRGGALSDAVEMVDRALLIEGVGMRRAQVKALREAREAMFARRSARS